MSKRILLALAPLLIATAADAGARCTYYTDGREPRCLYISDSGKKQYTNDRRRHPRGNIYGDSYVGGGWVIGGDRYSQRKGQGY
jgi:hypothetical protein